MNLALFEYSLVNPGPAIRGGGVVNSQCRHLFKTNAPRKYPTGKTIAAAPLLSVSACKLGRVEEKEVGAGHPHVTKALCISKEATHHSSSISRLISNNYHQSINQ